jgi:hypothetical protein
MDGSEQLVRAKVVGICTRPWKELDGMDRLACAGPLCFTSHTPTLSVLVAGRAPYLLCKMYAFYMSMHGDAIMHRPTQRSRPASGE